jgi:hypothetical protein
MVASCCPENTFSAMILLQASICASAGVVSVVQSGPSWLRDWADVGCPQSAASASAVITIERSIELASAALRGSRQTWSRAHR